MELAALVPRYKRRLRSMLLSVGVKEHELDDVLQDTAIALMKSGIQPTEAGPYTLIFQKAKWTGQSHVRSRRRFDALGDHPTRSDAMANLALGETMARINRLPEHLRFCLLNSVHGYEYHEIASDMGVPLGTVKSWIHTARHSLKLKR